MLIKKSELIEFVTALGENCGNSQKMKWYHGLLDDIETGFPDNEDKVFGICCNCGHKTPLDNWQPHICFEDKEMINEVIYPKNIKMKKGLKDYLHLYLGCKVKILENYHDGIIATLVGINHTYGTIECVLEAPEWYEYHKYKAFNDFQVKPILRPLSDMTEDEEKYVGLGLKAGTANASMLKSGYFHSTTPKVFYYLLSKHFDLFGLIEYGLAVSAAELKSVSSR